LGGINLSINEKLKELRSLMEKNNIDVYIVPTADPHQSEYVADYYKTREFITGFTGSQGTAVITKEVALLWADGRYFIQAEKQIENTEFKLMKMATPGYPSMIEWLQEYLQDNHVVGFDGKLISQRLFENIKNANEGKNITYNKDNDLIGEIWTNRPQLPKTKVFLHDIEYTGLSTKEKIKQVREIMSKDNIDYFVIGSLDDIAWLYNIRGRDIESNPVTISYALISNEEAVLYIDEEKLTKDVINKLNLDEVLIKGYEDIKKDLEDITNAKVALNKTRINSWIFESLNENLEIIDQIDITTNLKAIKNETEIKNQKNAYIKDGVAMTKLFYWIDKNIESGIVTELSAEEKLEEIRKDMDKYIEPSFASISAYKENAAMMHYKATEDSFSVLEKKGMYLLDAGGQYLDGTTDTTRTIACGELTDEEMKDFTLTLKGHINLISAKFLKGTTGYVLDGICRYPLWKHGSDYKCGTGHGVGYLLNVHEGPHSISPRYIDIPLEEGMVVTIEPGVYKTGKHGIRIENVVAVKKDIFTDSGQFLSFEVLSFVPIDLNCIDKNLLYEDEKQWLNSYHDEVYEKLSPYLSEDEKIWLKEKTKDI